MIEVTAHKPFSRQVATIAFFVAQCFIGPYCPASEDHCRAPNAIQIASLIDKRLHVDDGATLNFADDATFLRRVTLDLAGRIPTISEVREFLEDSSQTKRAAVIERLINSGAHVQTMATFWRRAWVPQADTIEFASVADDFEMFLIQELQRGARYDRLVRNVIAWNGTSVPNVADPKGFYEANESKPENLAASVTRGFLGINLDCAQCHDHPFSRWTREQFWQTAAFFVRQKPGSLESPQYVKLKVPETKLEFGPKLLSDVDTEWPDTMNTESLRSVLVDWMSAEDQQYLARNAVNRLWAHFFGDALIEPIDDLSAEAAQSGQRAALLKELAEILVASDYDTALLTRAFVLSNAYRLSTNPDDSPNESLDPNEVAVTASRVRGLTSEQLYNSLLVSAGLTTAKPSASSQLQSDLRQSFVLAFHVERVSEAERSISQSLTLMNGSFTNGLATKEKNRMLAAVLASPFMTPAERIDTIFIAVLGRPSTDNEQQTVMRYADSIGNQVPERYLGDLYWALINSPEFNTNH
jgi:hypothetical protein